MTTNIMDKVKTDVLFTLGDAETCSSTSDDWPDYLQYGFDQGDVVDLVKLVGDESLHNADYDSDEVWVPLHAWRTLGQLACDDAVMPLINTFDRVADSDDDWAFAELPQVMGMIGQSAIMPLAMFMNEQEHAEFSRVMAAESLAEIVKKYPALRSDGLSCYHSYIQQPDSSAAFLNGLVVNYLLDLNAKELIDDIRHLFEQQCVDLSVVGDIEDVEIALGFRAERATPKPTFELVHGLALPDLPPSDDDVVEVLDHYLMLFGNDESILDVSELDGFFAALGCSPHTIMPSLWMPAIWGGEALSPEWESEEEFMEFGNAVFVVYNSVMEEMKNNEFEAFFLTHEVDGKTYTIVDEWCEGFLKGINLWGPLSAADTMVLEEALQPIRLFATERGLEQLDQLSEQEAEQHQQAIVPAVQELYDHFLSQRKNLMGSVVRAEPKVGRNDPCPCGSGKKYKKCCLH